MIQAIKKLGKKFGFGKPSPEVEILRAAYQRIKASYDAARTTDEFKNYWANSDSFDADSANSKQVRQILRDRARYEAANNAFFDGIAQTITNDLVGCGPTLRMQSGSEGFNRMVETEWFLWCEAVGLNQKLWTMAHAKHVDGEAFAVIRRNPKVKHAVKLDVVLYEAEQVTSPYEWFLEPGRVDGIKFDEFGNPESYELLTEHPGSSNGLSFAAKPETIPAELMLHWFRVRRPGQHRGIPEMVSSLNAGAAARRWREATLSAAERAALLTLMMKTQMTADEAQAIAPFSTMDIDKGLMNFLPKGWEMQQADAKFPSATHEAFNKALINEMGRSVNMPRNKAACDSSDYNYASGRLDHGTYYDSLDVSRIACDASVLNRIFAVWFNFAINRFGWLGGDFEVVGPAARLHMWDWPKHRVADVEAEANANKTKLTSGQIGLHRLYSDAGLDMADEVQKMAESFGVDVEEIQKRLLDVALPPVQQGGAPSAQSSVDEAVTAAMRVLERRREALKPNGVSNAN